MRTRTRLLHAALLLSAPLVCGCEDDLTPITFIGQLDLVAVRAEVVGGEGRNRPRAGETYTLTPVFTWPERDPDLSQLSTLVVDCTVSDFVNIFPVCLELLGDSDVEPIDTNMTAGTGNEAQLECDGPLNVTVGGLGLHCASGLPMFTLEAPLDPERVDGLPRDRLVVGVTCNGGRAALTLEPESPFGCLTDADEELLDEVQFFATVAYETEEGDANTNPEASALEVRLARSDDDEATPWQPWTEAAPPPADACADADALGLPRVPIEAEADIEFRYDEDAIQTLDDARETIEISTYVNAGEVDRRFTVFRPRDDPSEPKTLSWKAPSRAALQDLERREPDDPVRFTMVVRDDADGTAVSEYYLCLVPKDE